MLINSNEKNEFFLEFNKELEDLFNVKAAPSYMLLLYIFTLEEKQEVSFYRDFINFLVKFFVRRNLTDYPSTRDLDQIFMNLIEELHKDRKKINNDYIESFFKEKNRIASDDFFKERLSGEIYETNADVTRFILSKIEESQTKTKELFYNFWTRDKYNKLIWTIEHILPEGQNIPTPWINMITDGDKQLAKKLQNEYVHKLGNLTLTGYNPNLSNYEFIKKRDRKDSDGKCIGYKNGLFLNSDLKDKDKWTVEDIDVRSIKLCNIALDIFKI
ncbi:MAG: HNH endonuclease family protein [Actinobacteria bacterium]|nr:HNH endonuclease family protein [Actinomycetota bacterium]